MNRCHSILFFVGFEDDMAVVGFMVGSELGLIEMLGEGDGMEVGAPELVGLMLG
jgi:hypothetical protein